MEFLYKNTASIPPSEILRTGKELAGYIDFLKKVAKNPIYDTFESCINLPLDEDILKSVLRLKRKLVTKELKYVVVVGIGGSNLGTMAVYDGLQGYFDVIIPEKFPKILFADTNDTAFIKKLKKLISKLKPQEILINAISKSGTTTETIANLEVLLARLPAFKHRLVITTDFGTELWHEAKNQNIYVLPIPTLISGRYSVFTAVGLFPLATAGFDIIKLLEGAMEARPMCLNVGVSRNPAVVSATLLYLQMKKGRVINDNFFFHPEFESLGKWYRQLIAESTGKNKQGITPTTSIGSTDLHSVGQLYIGGPSNKFFSFVSTKKSHQNMEIPLNEPISVQKPDLEGLGLEQVQKAILNAVTSLFSKKQIPYTQIILDDISEKSLGKYMQFKMFEIIYLAKLMEVNAFDQPNIEEYKKVTAQLLHNEK